MIQFARYLPRVASPLVTGGGNRGNYVTGYRQSDALLLDTFLGSVYPCHLPVSTSVLICLRSDCALLPASLCKILGLLGGAR